MAALIIEKIVAANDLFPQYAPDNRAVFVIGYPLNPTIC